MFAGQTANDVWRQAALAVCAGSDSLIQASRGGDTRELQDVLLSIADPRQRWISSRLPPLNPAFAIAEVVWIVNGRNDSAFLNFWNPALPRFQGHSESYQGAYGWRLRSSFGFDQLKQAYHALRANPVTRQIVLQIWDPRLDLPTDSGQPQSEDIPCNVCSMLKLRAGHLEWTQVMRSNDLFRGLPHNIVQFTYLQELMAAWLGLEVGSYTQLSDSLHVYEADIPHLELIGEAVNERNAARWALGYEDTMKVFDLLATRMDQLRTCHSSAELLEVATRNDLPEPARNMLLVTSSDAARRKGWPEVAWALLEKTTDRLMAALLKSWFDRLGF